MGKTKCEKSEHRTVLKQHQERMLKTTRGLTEVLMNELAQTNLQEGEVSTSVPT